METPTRRSRVRDHDRGSLTGAPPPVSDDPHLVTDRLQTLPPDLDQQIATLQQQLAALYARRDAEQLFTIARCVAGHVFSAVELLEHARVDPALRAALDGAATPKRVGQQLRRLARCHPMRSTSQPAPRKENAVAN